MITTCTTAVDAQLAHLGDLQSLLGATASSSGMDLALTQASGWVERYITGRGDGRIRRQVYQETLAGSGYQQLMVGRLPLQGIQRLFHGTDTGTASQYCSTDYRIEDSGAGFITRTNDAGFEWDAVLNYKLTVYPKPSSVVRPWMVVYEAGWQLTENSSTESDWATTTTGRTLPDDIERATLIKASSVYYGGDVRSLKVGPLSVNYGSLGKDGAAVDESVTLLAPYVWE